MEEQKQEKLEGQDKHNLVKEREKENHQIMQRQSLSTPQKQADAQTLSKQSLCWKEPSPVLWHRMAFKWYGISVGQLGSAVLAMSSPDVLCTTSLLVVGGRMRNN